MSEDQLLKALGRLAREQEAQPLPKELANPPSPAAASRYLEATLQALHLPAARPADDERKKSGVDDRQRTVGHVVNRPRRWLILLAPVATAAAAAVIFFVFRTESPELPRYALEARGGVAAVMSSSDENAPLLLDPSAGVELILRPEVQVSGRVAARFFLMFGTDARELRLVVEHGPTGSLRVKGNVPGPARGGEGALVVMVGRPGAIAGLDGSALKNPPTGVQVLRWPVKWR